MLAMSMAIGAGFMSLAAGGIAAALCIHIILMFPNQRCLCETSALGLWFATLLPLPVESLPMSTAAQRSTFLDLSLWILDQSRRLAPDTVEPQQAED